MSWPCWVERRGSGGRGHVVQMWVEMVAVWGSGLRRSRGPGPGSRAGSGMGAAVGDGGHLGRPVAGAAAFRSRAKDGAVGVAEREGQNNPHDQAGAFPAPATWGAAPGGEAR